MALEWIEVPAGGGLRVGRNAGGEVRKQPDPDSLRRASARNERLSHDPKGCTESLAAENRPQGGEEIREPVW